MSVVISQVSDPMLTSDTGLSQESSRIRQVIARMRRHRDEAVSLGWRQELYDLAMDLGEECSDSGWDGYDAASITSEAVVRTLQLIHQLPESIQTPHLVPSPSGHISFEWHDPERRVLSVSPKGELLIWAAVLADDDSQYGKSPIHKAWPSGVLNILYEFFSRSRSNSYR